MGHAIEITSAEHFTEVSTTADDLPIIIDFTATWCPPCQMIKPIFEQLAEKYQGKAILVKVDVDERSDIAE
jgi:thioredoxin 1